MQNLVDVGRREGGLRREGIFRYFVFFDNFSGVSWSASGGVIMHAARDPPFVLHGFLNSLKSLRQK